MSYAQESAWPGRTSAIDVAIQTPAVPWQIWVVVSFLGLEGVSNLFMIPAVPAAAVWLLAKCLFITGLIKGWKWVFVLFQVSGAIHVIVFLGINPIASILNALLMGLAFAARSYYFPPQRINAEEHIDAETLEQRVARLESELSKLRKSQ